MGMFRSLSVRNFRLFASGQLVSLIGTWMGMTTLDWLVLALGGGGTELGITLALQYGPMLLFGLYAGVVADRFPKLRLLLITQSSAAVLSVAACALIASGALRMPMLFVLSGLLGVVTSFDAPIRQAFIVEMVGAPLLPNAVALNSMIFNAGRIAGPAAAGGLIGIAGTMPGAAWVFGLNALSFAAVLTGLARIRTGDLLPARPVQRARGAAACGAELRRPAPRDRHAHPAGGHRRRPGAELPRHGRADGQRAVRRGGGHLRPPHGDAGGRLHRGRGRVGAAPGRPPPHHAHRRDGGLRGLGDAVRADAEPVAVRAAGHPDRRLCAAGQHHGERAGAAEHRRCHAGPGDGRVPAGLHRHDADRRPDRRGGL
ncbi:MFS transporter [Parafrankia sp. BMG5.11]|nr:MFS transporter [Parafrankia sp. BMG5.11]SQD98309.1 membrane hypothetical protein [Parafrankia sp. Ea1.12]